MLRASGSDASLATVLANIGDVALKTGKYERAEALLAEAVELQRRRARAHRR